MQFNDEKKKSLPGINTTRGRVKTAALAIEAVEAMKEKRNEAKARLPIQGVNHSPNVARKQANARASLNARLKARSYVNAVGTPTPVKAQPAVKTSTPALTPANKGISAINLARKQAGPGTIVAPTRNPQINGRMAANKIIQAGSIGAKHMRQTGNPLRSNSAKNFKKNSGIKNPSTLILGPASSHQKLMNQASGITGSALKTQNAWGSRSVTSASTASSRAKQTSSPRTVQRTRAGTGTGGGNQAGFWSKRRPGSASLPSTPRPSFSSERPASAPPTPSGGRGPKHEEAKRPSRSTQVGFR